MSGKLLHILIHISVTAPLFKSPVLYEKNVYGDFKAGKDF